MTARVLTTFTPALGTGRGLRVFGLVAALARLGPVEVRFLRFGAQEPDLAHRALREVTYRGLDGSRGAGRAALFARELLRGTPRDLAQAVSPELRQAARALVAAADPGDPLIGDGPVAAAALLDAAGGRPVTYAAHNVESDLPHQAGGALGRRLLRRYEVGLLRRCAQSWMASEHDLARAQVLAPGARLALVPNVVDVAAIAPVEPVPGGPVLFLGDFTYAPNVEGRGWLLDDVLPLAWERAPQLRVELVGRGLDGVAAPDGRVAVRGFVDDLEAAYRGASCAVVPLRSGSGSPLKFVEALAHGLPVVATPVAARGLDLEPGRDFLLADSAQAAAAALATQSSAPDRAIGRAGRAHAERHLSIEALATRLAEVLRSRSR